MFRSTTILTRTNHLLHNASRLFCLVLLATLLTTGALPISPTYADTSLPDSWTSNDIGNASVAGDTNYANDTFTVKGNGNDISWTWDKFHYASRSFSGDGAVVARVKNFDHPGSGDPDKAKYGVMIRESLTTWRAEPNVMIAITASGRVVFQSRTEAGAETSVTTADITISTPYWLRLEREGNTFRGYVSPSGTSDSWTQVGSADVPLSTAVYAGLAVNSADDSSLDTVEFDSVDIDLSTINAEVNWNSTRGNTTDFSYGLNGFKAFNPEEVGNSAYNDNLSYMAPGIFRYHSAEMMRDSSEHSSGWLDTANQTWDVEKIQAALSALDVDGITPVMSIPWWPAWMDGDNDGFLDADKFDDFAQFCADLVQIVNIDNPEYKFTYWEATNERDDTYYVKLVDQNKPDRLNELIDIYNQAAKAMKAVDPSIKVGGPAFARGDLVEQVERFVEGTANQSNPTTLDFLSYHFYASGSAGDSDNAIYNRVYNPTDPAKDSLFVHTADIQAILDSKSPNRSIPLWLDEYNISWTWETRDERMQNHKGAVYDALALVYAIASGVDATMAWNEKDGIYGKMENDYSLTTTAHTFHLMNNYFIGQQVATSTDVVGPVVNFAIKDQSRYAYLIINRTDDMHRVRTTFNGWTPPATLARHQISESGYTTGTTNYDTIVNGFDAPPHSVTVFTTGSGTSTTNLLTNAGFENGLTDWGNGTGQIVNDAQSGTSALMLDTAQSGHGAQTVQNLTSGATYTLSAWCKRSSGASGAVGVSYWKGETLAKQWLNCPSTTYTKHELNFTLPSDVTQLNVGFWNNWGVQYYDDIALIES